MSRYGIPAELANKLPFPHGWLNVWTADGARLHLVPLQDLRDHELVSTCWCKPRLDDPETAAAPFYVHNSMDRREEYEEGRKAS